MVALPARLPSDSERRGDGARRGERLQSAPAVVVRQGVPLGAHERSGLDDRVADEHRASSSVSISESGVTGYRVAFVSAAKYACSCAIASGGPAIIVEAGCGS